LKKKTSTHA
jgi:hypothetical protein